MDRTKLDLNLLVTLEALLAERNVTKAAARLNLSQPAVSAQLARLRDVFADPLLAPAHRGMMPTAKALELVEPLRDALDQVRATFEAHREFSPSEARLTVTLACTDYIESAVALPLARALRRRAPGVRLAVRRWNPAALERQLSLGEADLAITTPDVHAPHLRTRSLFDETYVLIGRRDHPRLMTDLTIEAFAELDHIIVSPSGGGFATPIDEMLAALGLARNVVVSAASFLFVPDLVAASDLVALVPKRLLLGRRWNVMPIELPWLAERFNISLIWHERTHGHPGHRWIRELAAELVTEAPITM